MSDARAINSLSSTESVIPEPARSGLLLLNEMDTVEARWHKLHQGGRHEDFDRIHEMRSGHFIKAHAEQLAASPDKALLEEGFKQCHR